MEDQHVETLAFEADEEMRGEEDGMMSAAEAVRPPTWMERWRDKGIAVVLEYDEEDDLPSTTSLFEELDVDFMEIFHKVRFSFVPILWDQQTDKVMKEPDFWGPLFIVTIFCFVSLWKQYFFNVIGWTAILWFVGASILYTLLRAMGAIEQRYSNTIGTIGYSLLPLTLLLISLICVNTFFTLPAWFIAIAKIIGLLWSALSATMVFVRMDQTNSLRYLLIFYPTLLLYTFLLFIHAGA